MPTASEIIDALGLQPHPEGGHFVEVFRSPAAVTSSSHADEMRSASTAIYFLLESHQFSAFHRVKSDEVWHHYGGDPLELHLLGANGHFVVEIGRPLERALRPLAVVPANCLQAARPMPGSHGYSLCGCTVSPGFEFRDFEMPDRTALLARFPEFGAIITSLTR
jgi:uncharacterized protein